MGLSQSYLDKVNSYSDRDLGLYLFRLIEILSDEFFLKAKDNMSNIIYHSDEDNVDGMIVSFATYRSIANIVLMIYYNNDVIDHLLIYDTDKRAVLFKFVRDYFGKGNEEISIEDKEFVTDFALVFFNDDELSLKLNSDILDSDFRYFNYETKQFDKKEFKVW